MPPPTAQMGIYGEPDSNSWIIRLRRPAFEHSLLKQNLAEFARLKSIMESGRDRTAV